MNGKSIPVGGIAGLVAALLLQSLVATQSAFAQDTSSALTTEQLAPVCLTGAWRDVPQVSEAQRGQAFRIVVAAIDAEALVAKGFAVTDCTLADLATAEKKQGWRDRVCEMAAFGNEAVQNQFERALGARPAVLCGSAELVAGQWRGRGAGKE